MTLGDYDCLIFIRTFCIDTPGDLLAYSVKKFTVEMRFYTNCIFFYFPIRCTFSISKCNTIFVKRRFQHPVATCVAVRPSVPAEITTTVRTKPF